mmetsp:Transcript_21029/g.36101  ORF Transcript_21029/g.36101 Transcript_21029/m.36101 type:complete len:206 (-) Transcript_21029:154-771(-)
MKADALQRTRDATLKTQVRLLGGIVPCALCIHETATAHSNIVRIDNVGCPCLASSLWVVLPAAAPGSGFCGEARMSLLCIWSSVSVACKDRGAVTAAACVRGAWVDQQPHLRHMEHHFQHLAHCSLPERPAVELLRQPQHLCRPLLRFLPPRVPRACEARRRGLHTGAAQRISATARPGAMCARGVHRAAAAPCTRATPALLLLA